MSVLLSSASPWQNDSNLTSTAKKRTPSLSIPRNKTTKNIKPANNALDNIYDVENENNHETENFQNISDSPQSLQKQNTIDSIQEENQNRMTRVQQLLNNINTEDDGQHLANFKPVDYSASASSSSETTVKPLYSISNSSNSCSSDNAVVSNPYSSYRDVYLGDSRMGEVSYFKNNKIISDGEKPSSASSTSSDRIMEKLNRMLHILEEQQFEPTKHITEEFILYTLLGVFVIYIVDSFTRAGKYIR